MELKQMKVADVLAMPEYDQELNDVMATIDDQFNSCTPNRIHRTIVDFSKRDIWEPGKMKDLYVQILEKRARGFSAWQRRFIKDVCFIAYSQIIEKLKADEGKRNNSNGQD